MPSVLAPMRFSRSGAVALPLSSLLGMACAQPARPPAVREPALRGVQPTAASLEIQGRRRARATPWRRYASGLAQVRSAATPDSVNRIVLVGDGVPNDAPPVLALALAHPAKGEHTPVTALGPGNDFDETLMTALAQRSAGTFQFVDDASRVAAVFEDQISRLDRVVARGTFPRGGALE